MQIVSSRDNLRNMSNPAVLEKYENSINLSSAELAQRVVKDNLISAH